MLEIEYSPEEYCLINDLGHKAHFINYLFRTDKDQKWTNELTKYNIYFMPDEDQKWRIFTPQTDEERMNVKKIISSRLNQGYKTSKMRNDVCEIYNDTGIPDDKLEEVFMACIEEMHEVWKEENPKDKFIEKTICFVMHCDQEERGLHIHRFYIQ